MVFELFSSPFASLSDVAAKCSRSGIHAKPPANAPEFDYIIVGGITPPQVSEFFLTIGGTAGCVIAKRLSASNSNILLLERGNYDDSFWSRIPLLSLAYARNDDGVLKYPSTNQGHLTDKRPIQLIAGKLLGGTSRVNNGLYSRCQPAEFVDWGEGWDFNHLKSLYDRSECNLSDAEHTNPQGEWKTRIVQPFFESSKM